MDEYVMVKPVNDIDPDLILFEVILVEYGFQETIDSYISLQEAIQKAVVLGNEKCFHVVFHPETFHSLCSLRFRV